MKILAKSFGEKQGRFGYVENCHGVGCGARQANQWNWKFDKLNKLDQRVSEL